MSRLSFVLATFIAALVIAGAAQAQVPDHNCEMPTPGTPAYSYWVLHGFGLPGRQRAITIRRAAALPSRSQAMANRPDRFTRNRPFKTKQSNRTRHGSPRTPTERVAAFMIDVQISG